jgi:hypothetical protein
VRRIVFVHGSVGNGDAAWVEQRPLASEFELVVLDRPGYPPGPPVDRVDFEEQSWRRPPSGSPSITPRSPSTSRG